MVNVEITNDEDLEIVLSPTDVRDRPVNIDGASITAVSSDESILANGTVVDAEGPVYVIRCVGTGATTKPGSPVEIPLTITITADVDLGDGVENISDVVNVSVSAIKAKALGLSAKGVLRDQPSNPQ